MNKLIEFNENSDTPLNRFSLIENLQQKHNFLRSQLLIPR